MASQILIPSLCLTLGAVVTIFGSFSQAFPPRASKHTVNMNYRSSTAFSMCTVTVLSVALGDYYMLVFLLKKISSVSRCSPAGFETGNTADSAFPENCRTGSKNYFFSLCLWTRERGEVTLARKLSYFRHQSQERKSWTLEEHFSPQTINCWP